MFEKEIKNPSWIWPWYWDVENEPLLKILKIILRGCKNET